MENKTTSKKFMSIFWCILYCMPLLILIITYIGYLNMYKENANVPNYEIETIEKGIFPTSIPNEGTINKFYINSTLSNEDLNNIVINSNIYDYPYLGNDKPLSNFMDIYSYYVFESKFMPNESTTHSASILIELYDYSVYNEYFTNEFGVPIGKYIVITILDSYTNGILNVYISSDYIVPLANEIITDITFSKAGWVFDNYIIDFSNDYILINQENNNYYTINEQFKDIFSITPYIESEKIAIINSSLYDLTLKHTYDTFKGFVMSPLYNVLNDFCVGIGINCNGLITNMIILIITWFIQLSFIRILIDFILLLPNLLRNFLKGVS